MMLLLETLLPSIIIPSIGVERYLTITQGVVVFRRRKRRIRVGDERGIVKGRRAPRIWLIIVSWRYSIVGHRHQIRRLI